MTPRKVLYIVVGTLVVIATATCLSLSNLVKVSTKETHYRCPKGTVLVQPHAFDVVCLAGVEPEIVQ